MFKYGEIRINRLFVSVTWHLKYWGILFANRCNKRSMIRIDKSIVKKIHTTAICRGHDPFSALLSFWQRSAIWCAKPSASSTNVLSFSLFLLPPLPFSVTFTILLVNICFHASTYREVDPRCTEESSTLTCPYVSDVIPSRKFSFVRGSERGSPAAFFTRTKDFV